MKKLSYLGPANTFSEQAAGRLARRHAPDAELAPVTSMQAVAKSLRLGDDERADFAVLPYYNYLEGLVQECLDLIYENQLTVVGAQRIVVEWALGRYPGSRGFDVIYSHPKGLAQCSEYLWRHYPDATQEPVASTAAAAVIVQENQSGLAIAVVEALNQHGLEIIDRSIGNKRHGKTNFTDFYLLTTNETVKAVPNSQYYTMIAVTPYVDRPGLLADILGQIAFYGINNAKIHSRPAIDNVVVEVEPQMFYLEMACHHRDEHFRKCVESLRYVLSPPGNQAADVVRVLGSYPRPIV